jgi:hypothetical protein
MSPVSTFLAKIDLSILRLWYKLSPVTPNLLTMDRSSLRVVILNVTGHTLLAKID